MGEYDREAGRARVFGVDANGFVVAGATALASVGGTGHGALRTEDTEDAFSGGTSVRAGLVLAGETARAPGGGDVSLEGTSIFSWET
jgi:hypothetical protein